MENTEQPPFKIRFRLPNGEEFEAEGTREFIETQRNYFLTLIEQQHPARNVAAITPVTQHTPSVPAVLPNNFAHSDQYLWEHLLREEEGTLILRKKNKVPILQATFLILAGARVLLHKDSYSALELAKSLKASNLDISGRLDRILAAELKSGHIIAQGSKRSRTYSLSNTGFANAFVQAQKLISNRGE